MNVSELRRKYIDFYKSKNHVEIASAPLLPENDPTVLFTTAGMHPLVPYLMGENHPSGPRLVDSQKCIRTQDIDEVGDNWHCTFFEMLGNWSLRDYFKKEAITWTYEFITQKLGFDPKTLAVTVYQGDGQIPLDNESIQVWKSLGFPDERIFKLPKEDNFWGPVGLSGPCGPDSETFFITSDKCLKGKSDCSPACSCGRYVEICNNVFMEYQKTPEGKFDKLAKPSVDFGMGLLRVVSILNGSKSVYESNVYEKAYKHISDVGPKLKEREKRIIIDHLQAALFAICDGAIPSNVGAGYIIRRLLRRAFRLCYQYDTIDSQSYDIICDHFIDVYKDQYPELEKKRNFIIGMVRDEESKFSKALANGLKHLEKEIEKLSAQNSRQIDGKLAFFMFESFGFPLEMTEEIAVEKSLTVDKDGFQQAFAAHQELSRAAGQKLFKGGLSDHSDESTKLHTATHLLHEALRQVLGTHVEQKGSNITPERLRFDFSHPDKMTPEQIAKVEGIVNDVILKKMPVTIETMSLDEAKSRGAIGLFEDRYGDKVNVYFMGDFSKEVCGGPHVKNTGDLGRFKIQKEEASSRGVRRIKAALTS